MRNTLSAIHSKHLFINIRQQSGLFNFDVFDKKVKVTSMLSLSLKKFLNDKDNFSNEFIRANKVIPQEVLNSIDNICEPNEQHELEKLLLLNPRSFYDENNEFKNVRQIIEKLRRLNILSNDQYCKVNLRSLGHAEFEFIELYLNYRRTGYLPDHDIYNLVIDAACRFEKHELVWGTLNEMKLINIDSSNISYDPLLSLFIKYKITDYINILKHEIIEKNIRLRDETIEDLVGFYLNNHEHTNAIQIVHFHESFELEDTSKDYLINIYNLFIEYYCENFKYEELLSLLKQLTSKNIEGNDRTREILSTTELGL